MTVTFLILICCVEITASESDLAPLVRIVKRGGHFAFQVCVFQSIKKYVCWNLACRQLVHEDHCVQTLADQELQEHQAKAGQGIVMLQDIHLG